MNLSINNFIDSVNKPCLDKHYTHSCKKKCLDIYLLAI